MNRFLPPSLRRLVLGSALLAATVCALVPDTPAARAAEPMPQRLLVAQADADAAAKEASRAARDAAKDAAAAAKEAAKAGTGAAASADSDTDTDADTPRRRHRGINIGLHGADRQYDSFDQFLDHDPALASMVLGIVFVVFLTPILIIGLIIWYKMRKNRMQGDLMLRLAEKGIVPPADAIAAVSSGRIAPAVGAAMAAAPLGEQVRVMQKTAAWSDLRKGVLMGTIGFALTLYAILEDGSPSWIGLVLLFLGVGYVVLWYFEDRQVSPGLTARPAEPLPPPGPGNSAN